MSPPTAFREELASIYAELDEELRRLSPVCVISGRCCRFQEYDHTLFLSSLEAEILVGEADRPVRPLDDGETCPWQNSKGLCTARDARPLGCRIYFCDPAYQNVLPEIGERYIALLKKLIDRWDLPWDYAPLHRHLRRKAEEDPDFFPRAIRDQGSV